MLKNLTGQETDTSDEVNKQLNKIIDNLNLIEAKVLNLDTKTDALTKKVNKQEKTIAELKKKGDK